LAGIDELFQDQAFLLSRADLVQFRRLDGNVLAWGILIAADNGFCFQLAVDGAMLLVMTRCPHPACSWLKPVLSVLLTMG